MHLGDIVFNGTDIYGDGVNLASRIENIGVAGAVLLSGKLNDELKNHPQISTQSLGFFFGEIPWVKANFGKVFLLMIGIMILVMLFVGVRKLIKNFRAAK